LKALATGGIVFGVKQMEYIFLGIIGIVLLALSCLICDDVSLKDGYNVTKGIITSIVHDTTSTCFYVSFVVNGREIQGKSVAYNGTKRKYHVGDRVFIKYYQTKSGLYRVLLCDNELKTISSSVQSYRKWLRIIGCSLIILFFILIMIKALI